MKSILLKIDDKLFEETEAQVKATENSRNSYIKKAIANYNRFIKRKNLEEQLRREVELIKNNKEEWKDMKEWEDASLDDLNKYFDQLENE